MKLLDQVRQTVRVKHLSYRTEQAYVHWIERYIRHHIQKSEIRSQKSEVKKGWTRSLTLSVRPGT